MRPPFNLFAASLVLALPLLSAPAIIPQPVSVTDGAGFFDCNPNTVIVADAGTRAVARLLSRTLSAATGYDFSLAPTAGTRENAIHLVIDPSLARLGDEGYQLEVTAARVVIRAPKAAGVFYGTGSLRQLLPAEAYSPAALGESRFSRWPARIVF
jgi:hexosaminidase